MQIVDDPNTSKEQPTGNQPTTHQPPRRYYLTGLTLIIVGVVYLFNRMGQLEIPQHLLTWQAWLILAGVYLGEKSRFRGYGWLICIAIGGYFLLDDWYPHFDLHFYFGPLLFIAIGAYFLLGPRNYRRRRNWKQYHDNSYEKGFASDYAASDDYLNVVSVFGGVNKNVMSKQFKGGDAVSIFGGTEINLMQADFQGKAILELVQIFGGCTLIVPAHWDVKTELISVFGGVEDNRNVVNQQVDTSKVLLVRGTSIFGGIEIKSY